MNAAELASLPVQAEQQSMSAPQPTLEPTICASALKRRLETWKFRSVAPLRVSSEAKEDVVDAPLCFDADFESGSLGPVTVLGESEYEVQLLSDANGGYVQWFCFRVRQMKVGMPYTFHLTNLIKPGSLFEEGCQPVLFSKRRMEECGIAWSREGADVAYYPCGFVGSRKFYRVSFDICFPFEEDECFLAYSIPYTYTDLLRDLQPWPWESLATTMTGNQVPVLRLGNEQSLQRACIVARAHPGETHASWVMRGVLDFLASDEVFLRQARGCLSQLAWLIVPMLNVDGVAAGRTRTNLDSVDLNRHHHDDAAPETKGLRSALQAR
ncbi:Cytosolic carboxypeptidase 2 (ATP/GTP-binding protein-like 2), partial [Durusdinium trenchii]